jgi:hypothetical protein
MRENVHVISYHRAKDSRLRLIRMGSVVRDDRMIYGEGFTSIHAQKRKQNETKHYYINDFRRNTIFVGLLAAAES